MELVNLTPHEIKIIGNGGGVVAVIPPSGDVARVTTTSRRVRSLEGVDFFAQETGDVEGLPEPSPKKVFIVSTLVRTALPERTDLASPGELVRNESGQPVGCRGLVINR